MTIDEDQIWRSLHPQNRGTDERGRRFALVPTELPATKNNPRDFGLGLPPRKIFRRIPLQHLAEVPGVLPQLSRVLENDTNGFLGDGREQLRFE